MKLSRAEQLTLPKDWIGRVQAVHREIERLPAEYGTFVFLYFKHEPGGDALATKRS